MPATEKDLPPQVFSTLTNLERAMQSVRQQNNLSISSYRQSNNARSTQNTSATTGSLNTSRAEESDDDYAIEAHSRRHQAAGSSRVSWHSDRYPQRASSEQLGSSHLQKASVASAQYHNMSTGSVDGTYQSTIGRRWGGALAQLELDLLAPPSALSSSANRSGGDSDHRRPPRYSNPTTLLTTPEVDGSIDSVDPRAQLGGTQQRSTSHNAAYAQQPQPEESAGVHAIELDALRRQSTEMAHLRIAMKDESAAHAEIVAALRLQHARELEAAHQSFREAKERLLDESYNRQLITFQAKEELYQEEIKTLQRRISDLEVAVTTERQRCQSATSDLASALEHAQNASRDAAHWRSEAERLTADTAVYRREKSDVSQVLAERESDLRAAKHKEQLHNDEAQKLQLRISRLEDQLRSTDLGFKDQLRRVEKEFADTNMQFEMLLNEASEKNQKYDRLKAKHRTAREAALAKEKELEAALQQATLLGKEAHSELQRQEHEIRQLRAEHARKEHELREERSSHAGLISEMQQQMEEQRRLLEHRLDDRQKELVGFEKTIVKLQQERVELMRRVAQFEEAVSSRDDSLRLLRDETTSKDDLHKVEVETLHERHREALAALKQSLHDRERKIEQLIVASSEPLQKLRKQLEEERSKRANLEQQLETHRRVAKEAEEELRRELKREQLRHPSQLTRANNLSEGRAPPRAPDAANSAPADGSQQLHERIVNVEKAVVQVGSTVHESRQCDVQPGPLPPLPPTLLPQFDAQSHAVTTQPAPRSEELTKASTPAAAPRQVSHDAQLEAIQSTSLEVFQRIMGSQQEFWQRCNEVVRATRGLKSGHSIREKASNDATHEAQRDAVDVSASD